MKKIYYDEKTKQVLEKSRKDYNVRQTCRKEKNRFCFLKKLFYYLFQTP